MVVEPGGWHVPQDDGFQRADVDAGFHGGGYREQIDAGNCTDTSPPLCNVIGYSAQSNARTLANVGTGFGVAGLAVIGAGAVVFLTAPRDLMVAPTVSERSAGVTVVGRF